MGAGAGTDAGTDADADVDVDTGGEAGITSEPRSCAAYGGGELPGCSAFDVDKADVAGCCDCLDTGAASTPAWRVALLPPAPLAAAAASAAA